MPEIHIVLAEPQIPQNTGNIARTCAVTGAHLHLIGPLGFDVSNKKLKRAGLDYWDKLDICYYENLNHFFQIVPENKCYYFTTKGQHRHSDITYPKDTPIYLMFGREDKGLPESLLYHNPTRCARIPQRPTLRSLNLSNAVAIAAYEVLRQWDYPELTATGKLTQYTWE